jgi:hypothetical protein
MNPSSILKSLIIILSVSLVYAKPNAVSTQDGSGLAINLIQKDNEAISGELIDADASFFVFSNPHDASVQVIPRSEVNILETNIGVDLFQVVKQKATEKLSDRIELEDGTMINCIILDVSNDSIQYFTGENLRRYVVSSKEVYMLHMDSDSVHIPFPMMAAALAI